MVKIMENPIKMDDLGVNPTFSETRIWDYTTQICRGYMFAIIRIPINQPVQWKGVPNGCLGYFLWMEILPKLYDGFLFF